MCYLCIKETWRDIPSWPLYQASSWGRVRSFKVIKKGSIMSPTNCRGYYSVHLSKNNRGKMMLVHRAVMAAFYGENKKDVDHINNKKNDNRICNLRYLTTRENMLDHYGATAGASYCKNNNNWRGQIMIEREAYHLGVFQTKKKAIDAYKKALHNYNTSGNLPQRLKRGGLYMGAYKNNDKYIVRSWKTKPMKSLGTFFTKKEANVFIQQLLKKERK